MKLVRIKWPSFQMPANLELRRSHSERTSSCDQVSPTRSESFNSERGSNLTIPSDWTTGSLPVIEGSLPTVPQGVEMQAAPRSSTVSWSRVSDVEGYVVLVEWLVNSEVGPLPFVYARAVGAEETSYTYNREFIRASVIAVGQDNAFSALGAAYDVTP